MRAERLLFFGAALGYLAAPGHPSAWLAGLPLGSIGIAVAIALLGWAIALPGALPRARAVGALLVGGAVIKLLLAWSAPSYGLVAEYRAGGFETALERSTEWRGTDAKGTRVDSALEFRGDEFPVHFFNDAQRFNYFSTSQPRRDVLPFTARWTGQVWAPTGGRYRFALEANGQATLTVPGLVGPHGEPPAVTSGQRVHQVLADVELPAGLHPIEVRYARPEEAMPWLVVRAADGDGELLPLARPRLVRDGTTVTALRRDPLLGAGAMALDLTALVLLLLTLVGQARQASSRVASVGPGARLERVLLGLFAMSALAVELVNHGHLAGRATILSGGNDWLAYEGFARDALLDGPLLSEGRAPGQGQPYYYQPLYIYWLALVHVVFGEGLFGPLFANAALGVGASLLVYVLGRELFGRPGAVGALLVFTACRATFFAPTTGLLLSENLLIPLVPLLLLLLARTARTGSVVSLLAAGVVLGLAGLTRTTPLAVLPPALLILAVAFRQLGLGRRVAVGRLVLLVVMCLLTISPATVRNYVVAGRLVPITSSAGANLWEAHRPSARVDLSRVDRDPLYERLQLDRKTREVAEFIRQDPVGYGASLVPMGLYAIGVVGAVSGTSDVHAGLLGVWLAYVLTTLLLPAARRLPTWFLHAFVWSHFAQMVLFFSHQYGFRLILPMYVAMMPIVGAGLWTLAAKTRAWLARRLGPLGERRMRRGLNQGRRPAATTQLPMLALAVIGLGSSALVAAAPAFERAHESFYGLSGDAAIATRQAARAEHLAQADSIYFVGDDSRSSAVAYLPGLAYPTIRWFDGARGLVLPPPGQQGLYVLPARAAADFARRCLGEGAIIARELDGPTRAWVDLALTGDGSSPCGVSQNGLDVAFEGVARLLGFDAPGSAEPGQQIEVTLRWEALATPATRSRPFVRLVDRRGQIPRRRPGEPSGQAEAAVYPSASWRAGELVIGTARLEIDPTLAPGEYSFELGFTTGGGLASVADDSPLARRGQQLVRGGGMRIVSRSSPLSPGELPITLPASAQFGGVRLLGASLDGDAARPGDPVSLTLFWQNAGGRLAEQEVSILVRDPAGNTVRAWRGGPVDGTYPTTAWKPGEIVRDDHSLVLPRSVPTGSLELAVGMAGPGQEPERYEPLSQLNVRPIARQLTQPSLRTVEEARFGELARLVGYDLKDRRLRPGDSLELRLIWQALAETLEGYTVSVQLQAPGGRSIARRDSSPSNGRRPTTGWLSGEFIEDEHRLQVPRQAERGRYRLVVMVYQSETWELLPDPTGAGQVVLGTEVVLE